MTRLCFLILVIALDGGLNIPQANAQEKQPYNVLLIAIDDLNDWGGFGGYPGIKTPNIDRLAKQGIVFSKAYCSAPACNPSRTSLLTGISPATSGVYHNKQPWRPVMADAVTLPEYFTANRYDVAGMGKIFHIPYNDLSVWPLYVPVPKSPVPPGRPVIGKANDSFDWSPMPNRDEEMADYKTAQSGIDYLSQPRNKPFFLAVGLYKPHLPWYVPKKYFDLYPLEEVTTPVISENDLDDLSQEGVLMAKTRGDHEFVMKNKLWPKAVQAYIASITFVDVQVGRLLDALEKSPYKQNTIVILFGDHGWHLGEKQHWRKLTLWEESTRVPFIVSVPGMTAPGEICERTVSLLNIYPTLVELCKFPVRKALEGVSLVPLLKDPETPWDHPAITTNGLGNHAVRTERWRYIQYNDGSEELYDHESDPNEWHNLAGNQEMTSKKAELAKWLPKMNSANAPFEIKD